ncbi:MauE/DoxX family redox-associated membrane protein [Pseudodesulfovibrio sediminis]|uniref:Methylamine utilisation protein MauE domain-containing protein n=1 Tax=Pseudodesulfovibrio sediminis TaxID=2810563 RepID=A0ABN6EW27_9BACT|nr:MauE/DoxX family redox-associated membrane protein [Pseudodesulfovibrio sediminis]BCS89767.1 hypothetical protein PSDVSF_30090 [Pseudodesulfovibrio sediminis]
MHRIVLFFTSIWTYRVARLVLGLMFVVAGVIKLAGPYQFAIVIDAFGLVPRFALMPLAYLIPAIEVIAGIGLILDKRGSLPVIGGMTVLFLFVLGYGLHLGLDIDCGCYGPGDPEAEAFSSLRDSFYRDLWLLTGVVFCYWWRWMSVRGQPASSSES